MKPLLLFNCFLLTVGQLGGPLLLRLYYLHGGHRKWLLATAQSAGFPILLIPLTFLFSSHPKLDRSRFFIEPKLFLSSALIGLFIGLCNFLLSLALSYLPVSTSVILNSTELAFVALFAFFIVKQRFTAFSVNSVVLMILGCVLLGVRASRDRPAGVSNGQYLLGFFAMLGCVALFGALWPFMERCFTKAAQNVDYCGFLQFQVGLSLFATVFGVIGMLASKDFQALHKEAKEFGLGSNVYCMVIIGVTLLFQLVLLGSVGVTFASNALFCGIFSSTLVPIIDILGVLVFHEPFTAEKGLALALCLWGLVSYFYGEFKKTRKVDEASSIQISDPHNV